MDFSTQYNHLVLEADHFVKPAHTVQAVVVKREPSFHYQADFDARLSQEGIQKLAALFGYLKADIMSKVPLLQSSAEGTQVVPGKVPLISHMIYVFKEGAQHKLSENNIAKIIRSTEELYRAHPGWQHYFGRIIRTI